ncbi:hypothetical protein CASFOL_009132 [Castilleja foliolosa]|uniref:UDP-glycosyltransferases domain-containing protein n=1 Tax=Castilleja foliolosa TaxID=1961234 RepID=A0ABD3E1H5_9LAMI
MPKNLVYRKSRYGAVCIPAWLVSDYPNGLNGRLNKNLLEGFIERVGDRGRVLEGWAPQAKILGHENTGGFVSHCGWNSVLESMSLGVPIIALPMHLDQPINSRLVGNVGVGLEVLRDSNGRLHGETLAAVIKKVVVEATVESVRKTAADMKEKLRSKVDEMDEVIKEVMSLCKIKNNGVY